MAKTKSTKNLSKGEKYDRHKTLNAERVKRFRQNMTEEQWEEKRQKDRERYKKKKEQNLIKSINELSEREKRKKRKMWKQNSRNYRIKKKNEERMLTNTPPSSDEEMIAVPVESVQKKRGRKQVKRDRAKSYRLVQKQQKKIEGLERLVKKYQKRLERKGAKPSIESPSPSKRVRMLLGTERVSPQVKKRLFAGYVLEKQLKNMKKTTRPGSKNRQLVRKVIGTKILRKYRVQKYFSNILSYKSNKLDESNLDYSRKKHTIRSKAKVNKMLQAFFQEDNVSKMCPGKRDYVKKGKLKVQRRILLDTLKNLHKRFMEENCCKISYSKFARGRPFWVTYPNARDRDTCACDIHSNMDFMVSGLNNVKAIKERTGKAVLETIVCSIKDEECMTNQCEKCKDKDICFVEGVDGKVNVKIYKWKTVSEKRVIKGQVKTVKKMIKHREVMKIAEAKEMLKNMMVIFKRHVYNVLHQSEHKTDVKNQLTPRELMLMIDFSENYAAKYESEVQSMHFGASKKQITLHTVVCYYNDGEQILPRSFCTVSDHLAHQAHAVWAHLDPVLELLSKDFPQTSNVHIFSDSPSSQYRNRTNLWLLKKLFSDRYFPLLKGVTWNYSEKGHGKGPMDGIGGTLKRSADYLVLHGNDITKASDFVKQFKNGKITVLEVTEKDVDSIKKLEPSIIAPVSFDI